MQKIKLKSETNVKIRMWNLKMKLCEIRNMCVSYRITLTISTLKCEKDFLYGLLSIYSSNVKSYAKSKKLNLKLVFWTIRLRRFNDLIIER